MTYIPVQQSKFGQTDSDLQEQASEKTDPYSDEDKDLVDTIEIDTSADHTSEDDALPPSEGYNLITSKDINYAMRAVLIGLVNDAATIKIALKSPDKDRWLTAINEEFEFLQEANTYKACNCLEPGDTVLSASIILKLKRDQHEQPVRYKGRLVARENFHSNGSSHV